MDVPYSNVIEQLPGLTSFDRKQWCIEKNESNEPNDHSDISIFSVRVSVALRASVAQQEFRICLGATESESALPLTLDELCVFLVTARTKSLRRGRRIREECEQDNRGEPRKFV